LLWQSYEPIQSMNIAKLSLHCRIYAICLISLLIWAISAACTHAETQQNLPISQHRPGVPAKTSELSPSRTQQTGKSCIGKLRQLGAEAKRLDPIKGKNGCGVEQAVQLSKVARDISIEPPAKLTCDKAIAVAKWSADIVKPVAANLFPSTKLAALVNASSYVCRTVNRRAGAKLSQHAYGRALDISGFMFADGSQIVVSHTHGVGSRQESFSRAVRYGGCAYFTTVLGPGSDKAHADHLHFDLAKRRSGYRLCKVPQLNNSKED